MIPQNHLSKLSNRLFKESGLRRIPEHILERDYCIAWFLIGLSNSPLKNKIAFKGGTALRRCYFSDYRFSEDRDFTLIHPHTFPELQAELEVIYSEVKKLANIYFGFSRIDPISHQNSYTFYLNYEGPLPASTPKEIKVDITIDEHIFYLPEEIIILKNYEEFSDLLDNKKVLGYCLNEIASEKTIALLDSARTEPRDLYDLWYLIEYSQSVILDDCLDAIQAKLAHRKKNLETIKENFLKKEPRFKRTWETRLATQMVKLPEFDNIFRAVKRYLRQANII